jgi:hypothetical protein
MHTGVIMVEGNTALGDGKRCDALESSGLASLPWRLLQCNNQAYAASQASGGYEPTVLLVQGHLSRATVVMMAAGMGSCVLPGGRRRSREEK